VLQSKEKTNQGKRGESATTEGERVIRRLLCSVLTPAAGLVHGRRRPRRQTGGKERDEGKD
jgi:hypothetical protein